MSKKQPTAPHIFVEWEIESAKAKIARYYSKIANFQEKDGNEFMCNVLSALIKAEEKKLTCLTLAEKKLFPR